MAKANDTIVALQPQIACSISQLQKRVPLRRGIHDARTVVADRDTLARAIDFQQVPRAGGLRERGLAPAMS